VTQKKKKRKLHIEMGHEPCTYVWEVLTKELLQQKWCCAQRVLELSNRKISLYTKMQSGRTRQWIRPSSNPHPSPSEDYGDHAASSFNGYRLSPRVKRPWLEAVKNGWSYTYISPQKLLEW